MVGEIKQKLRGYVMRERGLIPLDILLIGVLVVALSMDLHAGIGMSAYRVLYLGGCVGVLAGGCKGYLNQRKGAYQGLPGKSQKSTSPISNTICQNYSILIHLD
jgi:hypothetical protein